MAAALWMGDAAAASHRAALIVWGLDGIRTSPVELTTTGNHRSSERGLILHWVAKIDASDVRLRDGIRVTSVPRTLTDLCAVAGPSVVERAFESALRLRLTSVSELQTYLMRLARRRRKAWILEALLDRSPGKATDSDLEVMVWSLLREGGMPAPERQYEIRDDSGRVIARPDLAYPAARLALEVDGYQFHSSRRDWAKDRARQNAIVRLGWTVYRITWEDVTRRRRQVVSDVGALLASRQMTVEKLV